MLPSSAEKLLPWGSQAPQLDPGRVRDGTGMRAGFGLGLLWVGGPIVLLTGTPAPVQMIVYRTIE